MLEESDLVSRTSPYNSFVFVWLKGSLIDLGLCSPRAHFARDSALWLLDLPSSNSLSSSSKQRLRDLYRDRTCRHHHLRFLRKATLDPAKAPTQLLSPVKKHQRSHQAIQSHHHDRSLLTFKLRLHQNHHIILYSSAYHILAVPLRIRRLWNGMQPKIDNCGS